MKDSKDYTLISFYTNDWKYAQYGETMKKACAQLKIKNSIVEKPSKNNYHVNCALKPKFILEKLNEYKAPVLWTDVDNQIKRKPVITTNKNVAVPKMPKSMYPVADKKRKIWFPIHVLWFTYSDQSIAVLEEWNRICEKNKEFIGKGKHEHGLFMDVISEKNWFNEFGDLGKDYWHRSNKNPVIQWGFSRKQGRT